MFECTACGHSEMVHVMFYGCCIVKGCACLGMDGRGPHCDPATHADLHDTLTELPPPRTELERLERIKGARVTDEQKNRILSMKAEGHGSKVIARVTGISRTVVRAVIHEVHPKGPATQPRTRPRQEDWQRAMDAGITNAEYLAERGEGGRARTIDALNDWIAERTATEPVDSATGRVASG